MEAKKHVLTEKIEQELNEKYGKCWSITDPETGESIVFKKPDRKTMKAAGRIMIQDPVGADELTLENCVVFGDKSWIKNDWDLFQQATQFLAEMLKGRSLEVKNF